MTTQNPTESSLNNPFAGLPSSSTVSQAAQDLRSAAGIEAAGFAEKAHNIAEKAVETASQFRAVTTEKAREVGAAARERAQALKDVAAEKAHHFKDVAGDQWCETREKARAAHHAAEDYVRLNPTKCVLGAVGVGFLLGLIVRR